MLSLGQHGDSRATRTVYPRGGPVRLGEALVEDLVAPVARLRQPVQRAPPLLRALVHVARQDVAPVRQADVRPLRRRGGISVRRSPKRLRLPHTVTRRAHPITSYSENREPAQSRTCVLWTDRAPRASCRRGGSACGGRGKPLTGTPCCR